MKHSQNNNLNKHDKLNDNIGQSKPSFPSSQLQEDDKSDGHAKSHMYDYPDQQKHEHSVILLTYTVI